MENALEPPTLETIRTASLRRIERWRMARAAADRATLERRRRIQDAARAAFLIFSCLVVAAAALAWMGLLCIVLRHP